MGTSDPSPSVDLSSSYRTHSCGELRVSDAGRSARLIFLDLRDRHGFTKVVFYETEAP